MPDFARMAGAGEMTTLTAHGLRTRLEGHLSSASSASTSINDSSL
jgi:hypothetical protein